MFAKLTALVGGGYTFPYTLEEPYESAWGQWTHYRGKSNNDGSAVSVFKISAADPNDQLLVCARNGVKRLRMVRGWVWRRHPAWPAPCFFVGSTGVLCGSGAAICNCRPPARGLGPLSPA